MAVCVTESDGSIDALDATALEPEIDGCSADPFVCPVDSPAEPDLPVASGAPAPRFSFTETRGRYAHLFVPRATASGSNVGTRRAVTADDAVTCHLTPTPELSAPFITVFGRMRASAVENCKPVYDDVIFNRTLSLVIQVRRKFLIFSYWGKFAKDNRGGNLGVNRVIGDWHIKAESKKCGSSKRRRFRAELSGSQVSREGVGLSHARSTEITDYC
jgi:hypothetical protein